MPAPFTRNSLEALKRPELQKLCKDYGVKANLKSEALIDLLLDTQSAHQPQQTRRSVSTRLSSRGGPSRVSSVIIHDTDDEEEQEEDSKQEDVAEEEPQPPPPPVRTRKAKELQIRLGVGRPVAAGGSGPRAVTKSLSVSRGKRGKSSKTLKQPEATIEEEPEPELVPDVDLHSQSAGQDEAKSEPHEEGVHPVAENNTEDPVISLSDVDKRVADALRPLHEQVRLLKLELEQVNSLKSELAQLKAQVSNLGNLQQKVDSLTTEVEGLRAEATSVASLATEFHELKDSLETPRTPPNPSTPPLKSGGKVPKLGGPGGFGLPSVLRDSLAKAATSRVSGSPVASSSTSKPGLVHPGIAPGVLGKRHRDSGASSITNVVEEGEDADLSEGERAKTVVRPTKKRIRLMNAGPSSTEQTEESVQERTHETTDEPGTQSSTPRIPSFTIFQGLDDPPEQYLDSGPPITHLPDFFGPPSPTGDHIGTNARQNTGAATSSANASENQHPFNFSFQPASSTPANPMYMPSFPYPEPPQSPSPAGMSLGPFLGSQTERTDIFKSFGFPSPTRSGRLSSATASGSGASQRLDNRSQQEFVDPAALTRSSGSSIASGKQREVSSNDVAVGLGLAVLPAGNSEEGTGDMGIDSHPMKRTMYGTELDGDTRFGDFGVKGVATGFWAGGKF